MSDAPPKLRGFAKLSPEQRRQVASKGGSSVEPQERAFSRDRDLAARAGRVGGEKTSRKVAPQPRDGDHGQAGPRPVGRENAGSD